MNNKIHLLYGFLLGLVLSFVGAYLYVTLLTEFDFIEGVEIIKSQNNLGKLITLGAIPNLIAFFLLLKIKKDMWARGVVLATIALAISTVFFF
ncbi:MAG: hypothetical protein AB7D46_02160 [Flavobacteriaceae bacterium]